MSVTIYVFAY